MEVWFFSSLHEIENNPMRMDPLADSFIGTIPFILNNEMLVFSSIRLKGHSLTVCVCRLKSL